MIPGIDAVLDEFPEYAIAAAVIRQAVMDGRAGNRDAINFLRTSRCHPWLWVVLPAGVELSIIQKKVIALLDRKGKLVAEQAVS